MELPNVAPKWARISIIPAVIGFGLLTSGLAILFVAACFNNLEVTKKGGWIIIAGGIPIVWLFGFVTYRGADLWRFRDYRAALHGNKLFVSSGQNMPTVSYEVEDIRIVDHRRMQIIHVCLGDNGRKIFAVDYRYGTGMELVCKLREKTGEQVVDLNPSLPPTLKPTSSVRGSEDY